MVVKPTLAVEVGRHGVGGAKRGQRRRQGDVNVVKTILDKGMSQKRPSRILQHQGNRRTVGMKVCFDMMTTSETTHILAAGSET